MRFAGRAARDHLRDGVYKDEGVVKDRSILSKGFSHRVFAGTGVEDRELPTSRFNHLRWSQPLHHPSMRP
jgi:hypothetical protein